MKSQSEDKQQSTRLKSQSEDKECDEQAWLLAEYVDKSPQYREIAELIANLPTKEQKERLAGKFAELFYQKLESDMQKRLKQDSLKSYFIYSLNMGFIFMRRPAYMRQLKLLVEYAPLFKDEEDASDHVIRRCIAERLFNALPENTPETFNTLRQELLEAARGLSGQSISLSVWVTLNHLSSHTRRLEV